MRRRQFLYQATLAASIPSALSYARTIGANEKVRVGIIGCGSRGMYVARKMRDSGSAQFVGVCDLWEHERDKARKWAGGDCKAYKDFRSMLERSDLDAVLVATPDHWHAIPAVLACQAGKDVYVEKPLAYSIPEGRRMVDAARKHDRVVQTGTQQRSAPHFETMRKIIAAGEIGNVRFVRVWNYKNSTPSQKKVAKQETVPKGFDWDFYLGPAPWVPYQHDRYDNFRRYWDYAGGIATNYGTHRFDSVRHALGADSLAPKSVSASGQKFELEDASEDPDMVQMTFEFDEFIISYEGCRMNKFGGGFRTPGRPYYHMLGTHDRPNGMAFYGTEGTIFADRLGFELYPELKPGKRADRLKPSEVSPDLFRSTATDGRSDESTLAHVANFFDCVRSRATPVADVAIGHGSSMLPHLGNIACRTGEKFQWDAKNEQIVGGPESAKLLNREPRKPWDLI